MRLRNVDWLQVFRDEGLKLVAAAKELADCKDEKRCWLLRDQLRRGMDASKRGISVFLHAKDQIEKSLGNMPPKEAAAIVKEIARTVAAVERATAEEGTIFPGEACRDFVLYCNQNEGIIKMRIVPKSGIEQDVTFRILYNDQSPAKWEIIRRLVEADAYPIQLPNPNGRGNGLNLDNIFRKLANEEDNGHIFRYYIWNEAVGKNASYSLRQTMCRLKKAPADFF